jgi:hypothetical protein
MTAKKPCPLQNIPHSLAFTLEASRRGMGVEPIQRGGLLYSFFLRNITQSITLFS